MREKHKLLVKVMVVSRFVTGESENLGLHANKNSQIDQSLGCEAKTECDVSLCSFLPSILLTKKPQESSALYPLRSSPLGFQSLHYHWLALWLGVVTYPRSSSILCVTVRK